VHARCKFSLPALLSMFASPPTTQLETSLIENRHTSHTYTQTRGPVASRYDRSCRSRTNLRHVSASGEIRLRLCNMDSGLSMGFRLASVKCQHGLYSSVHAQPCHRRQSWIPRERRALRKANTSAQTQACLALEQSIFIVRCMKPKGANQKETSAKVRHVITPTSRTATFEPT